MVRLLTMYDDDADVSVSVNSRYPMNYGGMLIDDFERPEKDVKRGLYASITFITGPLVLFLNQLKLVFMKIFKNKI